MLFSRKPSGAGSVAGTGMSTKRIGDAAEAAALQHLQQAGLILVQRNYRTPGRGGGEIDLIMRDADGTLVFVEVRQRSARTHGGAAASVGSVKQRRIIFAARHYLMRLPSLPPCRFDVVEVEGRIVTPVDGAPAAADGNIRLQWLKAAFDAG